MKTMTKDQLQTSIIAVNDAKPIDAFQPLAVDGWTLYSHGAGHWIKDVDLGTHAKMKAARDIRRHIEKAAKDGALIIVAGGHNDPSGPVARAVTEIASLGKGASREITVYYLNEEAAVVMLTRLRTPTAIQLTKNVVHVFVTARRMIHAVALGEATPEQAIGAIASVMGLDAGGAPLRLGNEIEFFTVNVSPALAEEWLKHRNERNRTISPTAVNKYADDLARDGWAFTHQAIAFGSAGELIDGQHRLSAIVKAGVSVRLSVCRYLTPEATFQAKLKIDTGKTRSTGNVLEQAGIFDKGYGEKKAAICVGIATLAERKARSFSAEQVRAIYEEHREGVDWALANLAAKEFNAPIRTAFALAYPTARDAVADFAASIRDGAAGSGSPAASYIKTERTGRFHTTGGTAPRVEVMLMVLMLLRLHVRAERGRLVVRVCEDGYEFFQARRAKLAKKRSS